MNFDLELKRQHDYCKEQTIRVVGSLREHRDEHCRGAFIEDQRAWVVRGDRQREVPWSVVRNLDNYGELTEAVESVLENPK